MKFDKPKKFLFLFITCLFLIAILTNNHEPTLKCPKTHPITDELTLLNEIFTCSDEQLLIGKAILLKTISFMIKETDEYDPDLIEFVRSLIHAPLSSKKRQLNLTKKTKKDFSQIGQSKWIDGVLKGRRDGFFVEAGGYDGEDHSNTLFFELERNWTGILIEPVPHLFTNILSKQRNIFVLNACIANEKTIVAKLRIAEVLSGRVKEMKEGMLERIARETGKEKLVYVPCFSLNTIMRALNRNRVDYFSLDVEGGELDVIKGIKHDKITIDSFTIEHNGHIDFKNNIVSELEGKGFANLKEDSQDVYFLRNESLIRHKKI